MRLAAALRLVNSDDSYSSMMQGILPEFSCYDFHF